MKKAKKYSGVVVPMVTPLTGDLKIDERGVEIIAGNLISNGTTPFVLGTTGESSSMPANLKEQLVRCMVRTAGSKSMIYAGISGNSWQGSVEEGKKYADLGADALVCHLPSYYPVEPSDMLRYFGSLADELPIPLILYNMPATTGISIPLDVAEELSLHPNIAGMKDSERDIGRMDQSIGRWADREDFSFLIGWAAQSAYGLQKGADGIVPSTGNFLPGLYRALYDAVLDNDMEEALELQERTNYYSALYQQGRTLNKSLPALKLILSSLGQCGPQVLPPLYRMEDDEEIRFLNLIREDLEKI